MRNETVLVVDDVPEIRTTMSEILKYKGFAVDQATDGQEAIELLSSRFYDIVLSDIAMPRKDGMEVLQYIKNSTPDTICIMITGFGSIEGAVEALRLGAFDYLSKPIKPSEVVVVIEKALEVRDLKRENLSLKEELQGRYSFDRIVGRSRSIKRIFELVEKVARTDSTVLITGESGTGKELIAHAIHYSSGRKARPFVPINCAAIPEELLESELFGHEKGAFTHAIRTRIGRFELANKGTIFLDEIGEMSPSLQVKLLRVLQERCFERVGGVKTINVDIRVVAATNIDLEDAVNRGRFREDLFYRLNVIPIQLPPLRDRKGDIPLLVEHFLQKFSSGNPSYADSIDEEALRILETYDWPGNVRELENIVERLVILANGPVITPADIPERIVSRSGNIPMAIQSEPAAILPEEGMSLSAAVEQFEKTLILQALDRTNGVKNRAAKLLKMNRTTLIEKMKKMKMMKPRAARKPAKGNSSGEAAA